MKNEQNINSLKDGRTDGRDAVVKKATRYSSSLTGRRSVRPVKSMVRVKSIKPLDTAAFKISK